ncbi:glycine-rich cell wall structural protein 1.8-like [Iris pallida]|uniref:Glycine-rich cell wall structural protein 1.8-like n=1 Tax=Iris pallida TaxID=29817 RepID=A0AAX6FC52_IRIPA|nr:glycine-rich cell wall structural protein 1.8-like [Iris pallida]
MEELTAVPVRTRWRAQARPGARRWLLARTQLPWSRAGSTRTAALAARRLDAGPRGAHGRGSGADTEARQRSALHGGALLEGKDRRGQPSGLVLPTDHGAGRRSHVRGGARRLVRRRAEGSTVAGIWTATKGSARRNSHGGRRGGDVPWRPAAVGVAIRSADKGGDWALVERSIPSSGGQPPARRCTRERERGGLAAGSGVD